MGDPVVRCPFGVREMIKDWMVPLDSDKDAVKEEWRRLEPFIAKKPRPEFDLRAPLSETRSCSSLRRDDSVFRGDDGDDEDDGEPAPTGLPPPPTQEELLHGAMDADRKKWEGQRKYVQSDREKYQGTLAGRRGSLAVARFDQWRRRLVDARTQQVDDVSKAEARVVTRVLDIERSRGELREALELAEHNRVKSATHAGQATAFDDVTVRLNAVRLQLCAVVEAVEIWRDIQVTAVVAIKEIEDTLQKGPMAAGAGGGAGSDAGRGGGSAAGSSFGGSPRSNTSGSTAGGGRKKRGKKKQKERPPFIWEGRNLLLDMINHLNFLAASVELVKWYGKDFNMVRNPMMTAVPLDDRPPTPVKGTTTAVVGGELVEVANVRAEALREAAEALIKIGGQRQRNSASWWPGYRAIDNELKRVRRAEKILQQEEVAERARAQALAETYA